MQYNPRKRGGVNSIPNEVIEFHGIAFDEKERTSNNKGRNIKYPLVDWQITEKQALEYCYSKGFDWGGLYEKMSRVSCWCCPLSRISGLRVLYNDFPELWEKLEEMDKKSFRKFRSAYSVKDLREKFANENL
jgi:3'-phosphoadenosine 5'-phosphosulfate sulfotransferase (PAPS reductase)/FAD synthetase